MHLGIPAFHAFVPIKLTKDRFLRVDRLLNGEERMPVRSSRLLPWLMKYSVIGRAMTRKRLSDLLREEVQNPSQKLNSETNGDQLLEEVSSTAKKSTAEVQRRLKMLKQQRNPNKSSCHLVPDAQQKL